MMTYIILSYNDHHIIKSSCICNRKDPTQCFRNIKYNVQGYHSGHMTTIISSHDDHHHSTEKTQIYAIFLKRRGLSYIKYNVPVCHSCHKMIIQQVNLIYLGKFIFLFLNLSFAQLYVVSLFFPIK